MDDGTRLPAVQNHDVRGVLAIPAFRRLWIALSLSSLGDWLGLLATTALAASLSGGNYTKANLAIAGVFLLRLIPAIVLGPIAGAVADRLDRRWTMVTVDVLRFALFASIPVVGTLWWLFAATLLIESATLFWIPAKEASVPNLVPRERLESANQVSLLTTYGSAPVAALIFAGLALLNGVLDNAVVDFRANPVDLALYFNALTFLVSAITISRLSGIPKGPSVDREQYGFWQTIVEGWRFVGRTPMVRGLVAGMLGASAAGGAVVGLARTFVADLKGGNPGYGLLFGTVFLGLALGMFLGPRLLPAFSRRRMFALSIVAAGLALVLLAALPNLVIATGVTLVLGACAGVAWVTGYTLLGLEVGDEVRGRTFAFVQTMVRIVLVLTLALAPLLAAGVGQHSLQAGEVTLAYGGAAVTFLVAGLLASVLGVVSLRHMDDRRGVPLVKDIVASYKDEPIGPAVRRESGFFVALEGGEGTGKSTQAELLKQWLEELGHDVVVTHEPGATPLGSQLRSVLLDAARDDGTTPSARAEALLFAADRAQHVDHVVRPALARGAIVVTDRFVDSSVAYQGAGRELQPRDIRRISRWATDDLRPDLTVVLDLPPATGLARAGEPDRLEAESSEFHDRVRESFLETARLDVRHYLVVDGESSPAEIAAVIRARLEPLLPMSAKQVAEHAEARRRAEAEAAARRAAEERARREAEEEARRDVQERARVQAEMRAKAEAAERERRAAEEQAREAAAAQAAEQARIAAERQQEAAAAAEQARLEQAWFDQARLEQARLDQAAAQARLEQAAEQARLDPAGGVPRPDQAAEEARPGAARGVQRPDQARREQAERDRAAAAADKAANPYEHEPRDPTDPVTRKLSLADELFGAGDDPLGVEDETVQLPTSDRDPADRDR